MINVSGISENPVFWAFEEAAPLYDPIFHCIFAFYFGT
jgi:hypothetical protein